MRTVDDDLTARARIRDAALRLFAQQGTDGVSLRAIAGAADVSPGLIVHHFGSKQGLVDEVADHVAARITGVFDDWLHAAADGDAGSATTSVMDAAMAAFAEDPTLLDYLSRSFVEGGPAGAHLFDRLVEASQAGLAAAQAAGLVRPTADQAMRAVLLIAHDLGVLLLRSHIVRALGVDPLEPDGLRRWLDQANDIYAHGLLEGTP